MAGVVPAISAAFTSIGTYVGLAAPVAVEVGVVGTVMPYLPIIVTGASVLAGLSHLKSKMNQFMEDKNKQADIERERVKNLEQQNEKMGKTLKDTLKITQQLLQKLLLKQENVYQSEHQESKQHVGSAVTTQERPATQEWPVNQERSVTQEPSVTKERSATQKRSAPQQLSVTQERSVTKERSATQKRSAPQQLSVTQEWSVDQERPATQERSVNQERSATQEWSAIQYWSAPQQRSATQEWPVYQKRLATQERFVNQERSATQEQPATKEHSVTLRCSTIATKERSSVTIQERSTFAALERSAVNCQIRELTNLITIFQDYHERYVNQPTRMLEETKKFQRDICAQLKRVSNAMLDGFMSADALNIWVNGAAYHIQMLTLMAGAGDESPESLRVAVRIHRDTARKLCSEFITSNQLTSNESAPIHALELFFNDAYTLVKIKQNLMITVQQEEETQRAPKELSHEGQVSEKM